MTVPTVSSVVFTDHAVERWMKRRGSGVTDHDHARRMMYDEVRDRGRIRETPPDGVDPKHNNDAYLTFGPAVYPLVLDDRTWVAKTFLHRDHAEAKGLKLSRAERLLKQLEVCV